MNPKQIGPDWVVMDGEKRLAGPFQTNAEAWRWIDRQFGSPISPSEKKTEWIASKILGGAA